jgi:phage terminase small subunit
MKKLTEKQRLFVKYCLTSSSAAEAAKKAGYSAAKQSAYLLTSDDRFSHVQAALAKQAHKEENGAFLSRAEKREIYAEIARNRSKSSNRDRLSATDLDSKLQNLYVQKIQPVTELPTKAVMRRAMKEFQSLGFTIIPPQGWEWDDD